MNRISSREQTFLATQDAWARAMSGACSNWQEVEASLLRTGSGGPIKDGSLRLKLDEVCAKARKALLDDPQVSGQDEANPIWAALTEEHRAYWMRDLSSFTRLHLNEPHFRHLAWVNSGGMTDRRGFDAFEAAWASDVANFPIENPYCAYLARRTGETLTVSGDMAWASYDMVYPIADLPGFNGLGVSHEVRILERRVDQWQISFRVTVDDQFGQNTSPIWQVDRAGKVISSNPAATAHERRSRAIETRAGRLKLAGAQNDRRLKEAIQSAAAVGHGIFSRYRARSLVFEPDDGSPSQAIWVVNQGSKVRVSLGNQQTFAERLETATSAFGLSPAQCRLVAWIVTGMSLAEAARREAISSSTARTQVQRIFDKVGVRTQSGLVSALLAAIEHAPLD